MPNNSVSRGLIAAAEMTDMSLKTTLVGTIALNIVIQGAMHLILGMINNL